MSERGHPAGQGGPASWLLRLFTALLRHRSWSALAVLAFTGVLAAFAARVRPDYSIEMGFPRYDRSRADYERYKREFPLEGARAVVVVEADDLFAPTGLARVAALEQDLALIPGVVDTDGPTTALDLIPEGEDDLRVDRLFPRSDAPAAQLAAERRTATTDPLFRWRLAPPDGHAASIVVTLTSEQAGSDAHRTAFLHAARAVLARHDRLARDAGATQTLTLSGIPVVRSEFTELINRDLARLFPIAILLVLGLLYLTFRRIGVTVTALLTILVAVVWTVGFMGIAGIPLQVLTQVVPVIVMIISISDTAHLVFHARGQVAAGLTPHAAIADALADGAGPCLLTEVVIAAGFLGMALNDIVMVQQFAVVTAVGAMLAWVANMTVLPLLMSVLPFRAPPAGRPGAATRLVARYLASVERAVTRRRGLVVVIAVLLTAGAALAGSRVGREYYTYDDLRPDSAIARDLRTLEAVHGGSVPMAVFIESTRPPPPPDPDDPDSVHPAMLEPDAVALIDRVTTLLERDYPYEVKNAASLTKYLRKVHRLLAPELAAKNPLPDKRPLIAQELLALDDPKLLRDLLAFDRESAAVLVMMPDHGSTAARAFIHRLRTVFDQEQREHPYRLTITGAYGVSDGVYHSLVDGLIASLGTAVLFSFLVFVVVLRSIRLALIALVPNLLPLLLTLGTMAALGIDLKPSTVLVFSATLVIADDDTIQYFTRFRRRCAQLLRDGHPDAHQEAALVTMRECGAPMLATAAAVSLGFLTLLASEFLGLANLGLLLAVSLSTAVCADLYLSPIMLAVLRPMGKPARSRRPAGGAADAGSG